MTVGTLPRVMDRDAPLRRADALRVCVLLGVSLILAACGSSRPVTGAAKGCPEVAVLADAAKLVRFRPGAGRQIDDVDYQAEVTSVSLGCKKKGKALELDMTVAMTAERSASGSSRVQPMRFFVAVTRGKELVSKKVFDAPAEFPRNSRFVSLTQEIEALSVPTPPKVKPTAFEVLVGFDLTREEVNYNRSARGF